MNPELYERYLAKKAKKLGISVEELKAQGTSSPVKEDSNAQTAPSISTAQTSSNYSMQQNMQTVQQASQPIQHEMEQNYSTQTNSYGQISQDNIQSKEPQYIQTTIQEQLEQHSQTQYSQQVQTSFVEEPKYQPYSGMQQETVKTEVPSYIFGPSKMTEPPKYSSKPSIGPQKPEVKDNRENKFGLIGYPLGHSLSKVIHEAGFKSLGVKATYDILETPPDTLVDRVKFLKGSGYKGFNVTIPLKLPISLFVNEVDKYADLARAVNTIYIEADKSLKAFNTDVIGFRRAIPKDVDLRGKKVAILGTGGAAHAACVALTECMVKEIAFFTRNIPNSIDLMSYVRRKFPSIDFNIYQIENIRNLSEYDMLVNTTPIGMLGKAGDMMPIELKALESMKHDAVVYDVIYNPKKTVLIKEAEKFRLRTITGLDMLIYQAVAAQEIWFGQTPDFKDMKIAALEAL